MPVKYCDNAPEVYPHQEGLTCGEFNARGVLAGFDIPYQAPEAVRMRVRLFGYSFVEDISQLIQAHGLSAPVMHAHNLTDDQRIEMLKGHIRKDQPVILAIGNGHLRRGVYSPLARIFVGHFITLYGFDEDAQRFLIYDPYLQGAYHEAIPAGNEVRTFRELLRDWNGPFYYKLVGMDHVYIPVSNAH